MEYWNWSILINIKITLWGIVGERVDHLFNIYLLLDTNIGTFSSHLELFRQFRKQWFTISISELSLLLEKFLCNWGLLMFWIPVNLCCISVNSRGIPRIPVESVKFLWKLQHFCGIHKISVEALELLSNSLNSYGTSAEILWNPRIPVGALELLRRS